MADRGTSLLDFVAERRRKDCPVCKLPDDVRVQMSTARAKKISRDDVMAWLSQAIGANEISDQHVTRHNNGHHDRGLE